MAKKTQEGLLGEMIQLLRKQNQLSTRDRLKEAEETKRLEKQDEERDLVSMDGQGNIIDPREDFGRRIKANIAGKEYGWKRKAPAEAKKKKTQGVIAHATHMTRRLIEKANQMTYRWRIEETRDDLRQWKQGRADRKSDKRDDVENRREDEGEFFDFSKRLRKSFAAFLSPRELARQKRKEEWSVIKENWFKYGVIPLIGILTVSIGLAYAGIHLWHTKVWAALKSVKVWATGKWFKTGMFLDMKYIALRTSIYSWFGYDKAGKPMFKKVGGEWKMFGWAGMVEGIKTRLANLRLKAWNSIGLGVDGKPLGTQKAGRFGSLPVRAAWMSAGFSQLFGRRIGKIMGPIVKFSGGIAKYTAKPVWKSIAATFKTFKNLGAVKFIGRLLWPIAAIFSVFEGWKAGTKEKEREGSKWYTILGEATGGVIGYLVGGLADAIKGIALWGIKKMFGYDLNEDGTIKSGQLGGDALNALGKFSFADIVHKIVSAPFHAFSWLADHIGELLSPANIYQSAGKMWDWITDLPAKFVNWIKDLIPDWKFQLPDILGGGNWSLRKALGIEDEELKTQSHVAHYASLTDPATGKRMYQARMNELKKQYGDDWRFGDSATELFQIANDRMVKERMARLQKKEGYVAPIINNVVFQYRDEGYGDYIKAQRMETMGM